MALNCIPLDTNCAPRVADLFCYERYFLWAFSCNNQADTSKYLDDLLNIDGQYFEQMVGQILQLNKANSLGIKAPPPQSLLDLSITKSIVSSKICYIKSGMIS